MPDNFAEDAAAPGAFPGRPALDPEFLALLCCPACDNRPPVRLAPAGDRLLCDRCGRAYPISPEGIPNLLIEEAEQAAPSEQIRSVE